MTRLQVQIGGDLGPELEALVDRLALDRVADEAQSSAPLLIRLPAPCPNPPPKGGVIGLVAPGTDPKHALELMDTWTTAGGSLLYIADEEAPEELVSRILEAPAWAQQRRHRESRLAEARRLEQVLQGSRVGTWVWDLPNGRLQFSALARRLVDGTPSDPWFEAAAWEKRIHPDDRAPIREKVKQVCRGETEVLRVEYRIETRSGQTRHLRVQGRVIERDSEGRVRWMYGTGVDISQRKELEDSLRATRERFLDLASIAREFVFEVDGEGNFSYLSPSVERVLGYPPAELLGRPAQGLLSPERSAELCSRVTTEGDLLRIEVQASTRAGDNVWLRLSITQQDPGKELGGTLVRGVCVDITEAHEAEHNLQAALAEAEAAARARTAFLATMSHEIRTPMNGILGMADLLALPGPSALPRRLRERLDTIRASAGGLMRILDDVLDLTKLESGGFEIANLHFSPERLIAETLTLLADRAQARGVELVFDGEVGLAPGIPLEIQGDPARLRQLILHLVGTAIQTTEAAELVVVARRVGEPGEPSYLLLELQPQGAPQHRRGPGLHPIRQLGPAIHARLAHLLGGQIQAERPDQSTLRLPFVAAVEGPGNNKLVGQTVLWMCALEGLGGVLARRLGAWGMAVHRTRSVAESVVTLSAVRVDLILIDLLVPPPDATTLLRILRANPDFSTIPVIALAAPGDVSRVPLARRLGVQEVLIKPISTSHLLQTLRRCLGLAPGVGPETETPTMPLRFGRTPRILVAEDNLVNQQVAEQHLRALGAQVVLAADGQEAVERVQEQAFDLIFMDCHMPRMDGFEATRAIRAFSDLPIVALTAAAMTGDRERCLSAGMDDHIGKPLRRASLEAALRRWLPGVG